MNPNGLLQYQRWEQDLNLRVPKDTPFRAVRFKPCSATPATSFCSFFLNSGDIILGVEWGFKKIFLVVSYMSTCIFCKIAKGEIPSKKVIEGSQTFVFLDINPISQGHVLIVPKRHSEDIVDLNAEEWVEVGRWTKQIGNAMRKGLKADGFSLLQRNGKAAGQEVAHVHFHLIPRFHGDELEEWPGKKSSSEELEKNLQAIKKHL